MKVRVGLKKQINLIVVVNMPDTEDGNDSYDPKEAAYDKVSRYIDENDIGRLCAHCTGWGQKFSIDEDDEWIRESVEVEE